MKKILKQKLLLISSIIAGSFIFAFNVYASSVTLTSLTVTANPNISGNYLGKIGGSITVNFTASDIILNPTVTISGYSVPVIGSGNGPYTANYTLVAGDTENSSTIIINYTDSAGSAVAPVQTTITFAQTPAVVPTSAQLLTMPTMVIAPAFQFTHGLGLGITNNEVLELQKRLTAEGVYNGPLTGKFGAQTFAAVKLYQKNHGINQLGYVGPGTRNELNK